MSEFSDWHPEKKNTNIFLFFVSPSFTFGNGCCHITRINGRSGNEPKPFNPVLLYNANVFLPNAPKYANHHLQHKFSGSYKHLPKFLPTFLKESVCAHKLLHVLASSPLTTPQAPCFVISSPRGFFPQVGCATGAPCEERGRAGLSPSVPLSSAQRAVAPTCPSRKQRKYR